MQASDAKEPEGSPTPPPLTCAACGDELQLPVAHCPFCGTLQAARPGSVDTLSIDEMLEDVDWSPKSPPVVPSPPSEDARSAAAAMEMSSLLSSLGTSVSPADPEDASKRAEDHGAPRTAAVAETAPKGGRSRRRFVAVALTALICAALLARYSPPASTGSTGGQGAAVQPSPPLAVPVPTARREAPATKPPEPSRSSMRLSKAWKTVRLGPDGDRTSTSFEGSGPFRIRAGGRLYVVDGSTPVELDLRGLAEVDLRAVAGSVTVDVVASRNRSLVGN